MNVGAIGAIGSGTQSVYAILSPFLNGVVRTSNAAAAAQLQASADATSAAATQAAVAARGAAAAALTAAPPFANPAITAIADRTALGESLTPLGAATPTPLAAAATADAQLNTPSAPAPAPPSPANQVLFGDSGTLIQSYGAVALIAGSQPLASVFAQPVTALVAPAAPVTSVPRVSKIS